MYVVYSNSQSLPIIREVTYDQNLYRKVIEDSSKITIVLPEDYYEEIFEELKK